MIRIITSLVAVLTVASVQAQTTVSEAPKLVIGITIDQLRGDYFELFQHTFSEKGFKRLLNNGLVYQNMEFDFPEINSSSAIATIYTGANPFYNGIFLDKKYLADKKREVSIFDDDDFLGNYTSEKLSPKALRVSTITDELEVASGSSSRVYAFAPNQAQAIIMAGHAGNAAYWIEDYSGKWATTTYYKDFHWSVEQENRNGTYSTRIREYVWKPLKAISSYKAFPYTQTISDFQHIFSGDNSYKDLKTSPYVNENICQTALKVVSKAEMGKRSYPDFLALTLYAGNFRGIEDKNYSLEIQDTYARLDKDIATLLDDVEKTVGLKNTLIFVTSTGYFDANDEYPDKVNMPDGKFFYDRCQALLNMFLMAKYGQEQWVEYFYNNQIYLNRKLIEKKGLNLEEIQNKAAEFVIQFTGVQDVATYTQLLTDKANSNMSKYKNLFNKDLSGDIFVEIQPGFRIVDDKEVSVVEKRIRETAVSSPVIFYGYNIQPQRIKRTIKAEEIAPSICRLLRIRSPNAARAKVLPELFQN
ncbi:alkaline phosphatase family protein [Dysgonomonas sp. 520]|uniref:alkaline phosphatase family protein n=1 Tax=Dysgonomonas sp. 520 TaxID=2302931 RepID=UPI0013D00550|nr:alkaline phosphatase family protein [Dysgonomonas sp. 520]NDW09076.1 alkaline phosphatase family protein [Dysgonomonas sp. 520]